MLLNLDDLIEYFFHSLHTVMGHEVGVFLFLFKILHFAPDHSCITDKQLEFHNKRQFKQDSAAIARVVFHLCTMKESIPVFLAGLSFLGRPSSWLGSRAHDNRWFLGLQKPWKRWGLWPQLWLCCSRRVLQVELCWGKMASSWRLTSYDFDSCHGNIRQEKTTFDFILDYSLSFEKCMHDIYFLKRSHVIPILLIFRLRLQLRCLTWWQDSQKTPENSI